MNFESKFILDKPHYSECFEQSNTIQPNPIKRHLKAIVLLCFGLFFYMVQIEGLSGHLGAFFFILAFVEVLSVIYAKVWWVTRQMWSKASGSEVAMTLNEQGIEIKSDFSEYLLKWQDIQSFKETDKGVILFPISGGNSYISKTTISADGWRFLKTKLG
ncbi:hypothetical protein A9Q98_05745 [Thalassotalea sp. 42_200_T64]|nr:hypothetical protein A9Q98_05745 [Thalassotalea sp. 42_200_T64]